MKKFINLLGTCFICAAILTGCEKGNDSGKEPEDGIKSYTYKVRLETFTSDPEKYKLRVTCYAKLGEEGINVTVDSPFSHEETVTSKHVELVSIYAELVSKQFPQMNVMEIIDNLIDIENPPYVTCRLYIEGELLGDLIIEKQPLSPLLTIKPNIETYIPKKYRTQSLGLLELPLIDRERG